MTYLVASGFSPMKKESINKFTLRKRLLISRVAMTDLVTSGFSPMQKNYAFHLRICVSNAVKSFGKGSVKVRRSSVAGCEITS
jgi:hypothetical protein